VAAKLKGLQIDTCPFVNLPERKRTQRVLTREEMKNCVCTNPFRTLAAYWNCPSAAKGAGREYIPDEQHATNPHKPSLG